MKKNATTTTYAQRLGDYYRELEGAETNRWSSSPLCRYLGELLETVQQLPSPEREGRFVEEILGSQNLRLKKAA